MFSFQCQNFQHISKKRCNTSRVRCRCHNLKPQFKLWNQFKNPPLSNRYKCLWGKKREGKTFFFLLIVISSICYLGKSKKDPYHSNVVVINFVCLSRSMIFCFNCWAGFWSLESLGSKKVMFPLFLKGKSWSNHCWRKNCLGEWWTEGRSRFWRLHKNASF